MKSFLLVSGILTCTALIGKTHATETIVADSFYEGSTCDNGPAKQIIYQNLGGFSCQGQECKVPQDVEYGYRVNNECVNNVTADAFLEQRFRGLPHVVTLFYADDTCSRFLKGAADLADGSCVKFMPSFRNGSYAADVFASVRYAVNKQEKTVTKTSYAGAGCTGKETVESFPLSDMTGQCKQRKAMVFAGAATKLTVVASGLVGVVVSAWLLF